MGKPNGPPQMMGKPNGTPSIHHFSHPHPLELHVSNAQQPAMNVMGSCSGCKLSASGTFYVCKPCNYILHITCSQMPQKITHPADPHHTLSLLPVPAYPEGRFNCDACGLSGNGFSYHCHVCDMDIHTLCAVKPLSVNHQSHHHPLTLNFSPPYQGKSFICDICHQEGSNHWLYRCNSCEFDAHLSCARTKPRTLPQTDQTRPIYQRTAQRTPYPQPTQTQPIYQQTTVHRTATPHNYGAAGPNQTSAEGNGSVSSPIQNVMTGVAEQLSKTVIQNFTGGQQGQTQTRPIYQQTVQTQPIYQQTTVNRTATPHNYGAAGPNHYNYGAARPNQTSAEGNGSVSSPIQNVITGIAEQLGKTVIQNFTGGQQGQTQTRPIYQQTVQTQPIYQQTVHRPAIPHHNNESHFTWREGGNEYGNPNEVIYGDVRPDQRGDQVTFTWREGGDEYGNPNEVVMYRDAGPDQRGDHVEWRERGKEYDIPNEVEAVVVNGDAGPDQKSEQETRDSDGSCYEENLDFSGSDGGVAFDFSLTVGNTDGGSADGSVWDSTAPAY